MKTITICAQAGGQCKTTVGINLAHLFKLEGYNVLIIVADTQQDAESIAGIKPGPALYDVCTGKAGINETIQHLEICDILPNDIRGAELTNDLPIDSFRIIADNLRSQYDVIIIDTGSTMTAVLASALHAADLAIICTEASSKGARMMAKLKSGLLDQLEAPGIVLFTKTQNNENGRQMVEALNDLANNLQLPTFKNNFPYSTAVLNAGNENKTIYQYNKGQIRKQFKEIYQEVKEVLSDER